MSWLLAIFILEQALDFWTTWQIFRFGGYEQNNVLAWCILKFGLMATLLAWKIAPIIFVWAAITLDQMPWQLLAPIELLYLWVIAHNERQRRKHIRS